jgi:hypothetical protein
MNWDAIGAIAELLGAVGVIASLVYLAGQIRGGQTALRASTYAEVARDIHETINSTIRVPGLASLVRSGMADFDALKDEEAFEFNFWITGVMGSYDTAFYQYRMGTLDKERWEMHLADCATVLKAPGVEQWWRSARERRSSFSPGFLALLEEILAEEPDRGE